MTQPSPQQNKLLALLRELFQLDQPDLDFGLYRIMHAKAREIEHFLEHDLLDTIREKMGGNQADKIAQARLAYERERQNAIDYGGNPDTVPKVQQALAEYKAAQEGREDDAELFDHLYRFFERYYEGGDFLTRRYYARETSEKAAPYAVPYDGSEVYLHWANKDQYYIKTTESFRQFSVDLAQAKSGGGQLFSDNTTRKLHFTVVEAEEGAHNNVKAASDKERYFILDAGQPLAWRGDELDVRFHYRADPDKTGQAGKWREARNARNAQGILDALAQQSQGTDAQSQLAQYFHQALATEVPRGKSGDRQTLLVKYLNQFTARNSMDYFIHKDLGGFLKRELDFYIKNELFRLDDLGNADAPNPQQYDKLLKKALTLREVAHKLIVFLAQTEDFQKKLWLKKKFVVDTQWLVTLDKVPASLYPQIEGNEAQWAEWEALGFVAADARRGELLKPESRLVLDTRFYDAAFTAQLLASIANLDDATDGVLVHSENFQALNLMQERYREQVKCIYIDPPYNTGNDDFPYKDSYQHSSWMSMMLDRAQMAKNLQAPDGLLSVQIGDEEVTNVRALFDAHFAERKNSSVVRRGIKNVQAQFKDIDRLSLGYDVIHSYAKRLGLRLAHLRQALADEKPGKWDTFWRGTDRGTMRYELFGKKPETGQWRWEENRAKRAIQAYLHYQQNESASKSLDEWYAENYQCGVDLDFVRMSEEGTVQYYVPPQNFRLVSDNWLDIPASGNVTEFAHEKSLVLLQRVISWSTQPGDFVLDYFGGSGSTAHAAFSMPPYGEGCRKYILVEMGDYFDTVLKPRIAKVVYSADWKEGKPIPSPQPSPQGGEGVGYGGISQLVKVIRLESYEDTLNNLLVAEESAQREVVEANPALREHYFLHYLLELETRGSPSLLNVAAFTDPTAYTLNIKKPGSEVQARRAVDLVETFTWLLGLRVSKLHAPQIFTAEFIQEADPDLPGDTPQRMVLSGKLEEVMPSPPAPLPVPARGIPTESGSEAARSGETGEGGRMWWFRAVQGVIQGKRSSGHGERVLVVWRKLTGNLEQDNLVLVAYLREALGFDVRRAHDAAPFDAMYVNGSHALPAMPHCEVRQLEEAFHHLMWDVQDV